RSPPPEGPVPPAPGVALNQNLNAVSRAAASPPGPTARAEDKAGQAVDRAFGSAPVDGSSVPKLFRVGDRELRRRRSDARSLLTGGRRSGGRSDQAKRLPLVAGVFRLCWPPVVPALFSSILTGSIDRTRTVEPATSSLSVRIGWRRHLDVWLFALVRLVVLVGLARSARQRAVFNSRGHGDAVLALLAAGADRDR